MPPSKAFKQRAGRFVMQPTGYTAFIPKPLPPEPPLQVDEPMQTKLALAERELGRLDSVSQLVPDPERFVYMYVRQEAVLSSQIEGTQASLAELLEYEATEEKGDKTVDLAEVLNYVDALQEGLRLLSELPVCNRLLRRVHDVLMRDARGGGSPKTPGELRRSQNWIGGTSPRDARFVPPPVDDMKSAMADLEKYLNADKATPLLIEIGLVHAQFETIHPFLDGNGRLGRLLITFLLAARGVLSKPLLYLSHYFKKNRDDYYARLQAVRTAGDWEGWLSFFLGGIAAVASEATDRARKIIALRENHRALVHKRFGARAGRATGLLEILTRHPYVTSSQVREQLALTQPTVDRLLREFIDAGLVRETTGRKWGRLFAYTDYLKLFEAA